jgi:hypothetical protein
MGVHNMLTYRTVLLVELLHCGIYLYMAVSLYHAVLSLLWAL